MNRLLFAGLSLFWVTCASFGAVVTLTPSEINGLDTTTAFFDNGEIRLTPLIRDAAGVPQPATFNASGDRLGIDGNGTNENAFNDANITVGDLGDELLLFELAPMSGLTQISWDFSRANGPDANSGVFISGFLSDPNVAFSGVTTGLTGSYDSGSGTLRLNVTTFTGPDTFVDFDPLASVGQTLTLRVNDVDQAGAQVALTSISYDNAVVAIPEPASLAFVGIAAAGFVWRRRRA